MSFFKRNNPNVLGIDISTSAIKLIELSRQGSRYRVESYAVAALPENAVIDNNFADIEAIGQALKTVVDRSGTKLKQAAVAVTGSAVITKVISIPRPENDEELVGQVEMLADQYIPYALDEVNLDFSVIGENESNRDMVDVQLAASRRENIDDRVAALEIAGLKAKVIDVEAYALENAYGLLTDALPDYGPDATIAIADTGSSVTTLNIIHKNKVVYSREQGFGGKQLTEEIQRRYGLSYEEAGMAKKHGGLPDNYINEVLDPFKDVMSQQIGRSLQFFFSSSSQHNVDQIILAGGTSSLTGIESLIEEKLSTPTIVANPFSQMTLAAKIKAQALSNDAPAMMIATGLALRSFD
ncbi:MAG: pilus assembly protein PilM [Piscirickettsiaceae bacterium]|nr:MAG: pilus assembly protein PilM [Piscirickettsiaceae bacterium]PCI66654.1 MAG: pilus assembly protein PilM [Piscirickettsiaceae bacterium]